MLCQLVMHQSKTLVFGVCFSQCCGMSDGPREQSGYAEEFYTSIKTSYIAAGNPE